MTTTACISDMTETRRYELRFIRDLVCVFHSFVLSNLLKFTDGVSEVVFV